MLGFLRALFLACRPKTLVASLCPVVLGAVLSYRVMGEVSFELFGLILGTAFLIQIATNFFNDAIDFDEGRDTDARLGPRRMTASGEIPSRLLKFLAVLCLCGAFTMGITLARIGGWEILAIGASALFLAYLYTGSGFSLASLGIADVFVILYFGVFAVWGTELILVGGSAQTSSMIVGLQCGLLCNVLLLINNLRDEQQDQISKKKTLVVRFGRNIGLGLLGVCFFMPYFINFVWFQTDLFRAGLWSFLSLPLAIFVMRKIILTSPSSTYNKYIGVSALHQILFVSLFSLGVVLS